MRAAGVTPGVTDGVDPLRRSTGLRGKRVLVGRAEGQTAMPERLLRECGADPVILPMVEIGPPDDAGPLRRALASLPNFAWVVFTSANGVEYTWRALTAEGQGREAFGEARFAVVGSATRETLEGKGVLADAVAKESHGAGVAAALLERLGTASPSATRVLLLRAQEASVALPRALLAAGVQVDDVPVYRTRPSRENVAEVRHRFDEGSLDVVIFSSGSIVNAICEALGPLAPAALARVTVACIGPVTAEAARARGVRVDVVPTVANFPGVIRALETWTRSI